VFSGSEKENSDPCFNQQSSSAPQIHAYLPVYMCRDEILLMCWWIETFVSAADTPIFGKMLVFILFSVITKEQVVFI